MSVGSYEVSYRPLALGHRMAQWSGAHPDRRAAGGSNRGSGIRFFETASPHTPYISTFLGRPPRAQAPNLSIFWTGLPAGTPKIYPHRWTAFVRIFRGPGRVSPKPTDIFPMRPSFGRTVTQGHSAPRRWNGCLRSVAGNWGTLGLYDLAATFPQKIQDDLQERRREAGERNWCVYRVLLPRTILMALLEQVKQLGRAFTARLRHAIHVRGMVQAQEYRAGRLARRLRVSRV